MNKSYSPLFAGLVAIALGILLLRIKIISFTLFILGGYLVMRALRSPSRDPYDLEELRRMQEREREAERRRRSEELN